MTVFVEQPLAQPVGMLIIIYSTILYILCYTILYYTSSCEITEVRPGVAKLVLGWVTAWCFLSCLSLSIGVTSGDVQ